MIENVYGFGAYFFNLMGCFAVNNVIDLCMIILFSAGFNFGLRIAVMGFRRGPKDE